MLETETHQVLQLLIVFHPHKRDLAQRLVALLTELMPVLQLRVVESVLDPTQGVRSGEHVFRFQAPYGHDPKDCGVLHLGDVPVHVGTRDDVQRSRDATWLFRVIAGYARHLDKMLYVQGQLRDGKLNLMVTKPAALNPEPSGG